MNIEIVISFFKYITATLYFFTAFFSLWEALRNEKNEPIKAWFRNIWNIINESNWVKFPEIIINWFLESIESFRKKIFNPITKIPYLHKEDANDIGCAPILLNILFFSLVAAIYYLPKYNMYRLIIIIFSTLIGLILFAWYSIYFSKNNPFLSYYIIEPFYSFIIFSFGFSILFIVVSPIIWIFILLKSNLNNSFFIYIILCISIWGFISVVFKNRERRYNTFTFFIILASLLITLVSFLVGHLIHPDLWIPKTLQMIISNAIFDILTIYITIYLLTWALKNKNIFSIPIAVFADVALATLLACFSLYLGLIFSDKSLSIEEVYNVLIANSPDGTNIELGPYFWVMHSTFIPTLFYCVMIFFAWLAKVILIPAVWFFGKGQENKSPLKLTAALFGIIGSVFALFALFLGTFK